MKKVLIGVRLKLGSDPNVVLGSVQGFALIGEVYLLKEVPDEDGEVIFVVDSETAPADLLEHM